MQYNNSKNLINFDRLKLKISYPAINTDENKNINNMTI